MTGENPAKARTPWARERVRSLSASKVREVANAGFGVPDVRKFWFGEGDQPTRLFIREAAIAALSEGRTFFGPEGEGWLRWCFATSEQAIDDGLARLDRWLTGR